MLSCSPTWWSVTRREMRLPSLCPSKCPFAFLQPCELLCDCCLLRGLSYPRGLLHEICAQTWPSDQGQAGSPPPRFLLPLPPSHHHPAPHLFLPLLPQRPASATGRPPCSVSAYVIASDKTPSLPVKLPRGQFVSLY